MTSRGARSRAGLPSAVLRRWRELAPGRQDALLVAVLTAAGLAVLVAEPVNQLNGVTRSADALGVALVVGSTLPLAWRRRWPLALLVPMTVLASTALALGYAASLSLVWTAFAVGSAAVHSRRPVAVPLTLLGSVGTLGSVFLFEEKDVRTPLVAVIALLLGGMPAVVGYALRTQRALNAELAEQASRAVRLRTSELQRAVAEERMQIAREVHDIVGHHLSAINLQAGGGRRVAMRSGGGPAAATFGVIEHLSSQALDEIRRTLGMLRQATADLGPLPGLHDLDQLLASFRAAGVAVELEVQGRGPDLSPAVGTCAYRIVQEALTNVAKHARPARALLRIHYDGREVRVLVRDWGTRRSAAPGQDQQDQQDQQDGRDGQDRQGGHGLLGMRERAELLGGRLDAGPDEQGWHVRAVLPVGTAA
jgi:signal transduction histidine kinase